MKDYEKPSEYIKRELCKSVNEMDTYSKQDLDVVFKEAVMYMLDELWRRTQTDD